MCIITSDFSTLFFFNFVNFQHFILNILLRRNLTIKKSLQMMNKKIISCLQHTYKEQPEDMCVGGGGKGAYIYHALRSTNIHKIYL